MNVCRVKERRNLIDGRKLLRDFPPSSRYLIGVSGCYFGMTAGGGTEGVGRAATRGVVVATLSVVISNVLLVKLIQLVG